MLMGPRDLTTLPTGLLPVFKLHERIDFPDDDDLIKDKLAFAIERMEIKCEIGIFAASYTLGKIAFCDGRMRLPRPPAVDFTATVPGTPDPVDVKDQYSIETESYGGEIAAYYLVGAAQDGLAVSITTGYTAADQIPPGIRDIVLRAAGHLYEYREIYVSNNVHMQSQWLDDLYAGYWQPRV